MDIIINFCRKSINLWYINILGLMLLFLKVVGVFIPIGYFLIFSIIMWQITLITTLSLIIILCLIAGGIAIWLEEREKVNI